MEMARMEIRMDKPRMELDPMKMEAAKNKHQ
jgi:hypothetical protein